MEQQQMGVRHHARLLATLAVLALAASPAALSAADDAAKALPQNTFEGLKLIPGTKVSAVYMREGVDFSGYDKVAILDCNIAFRKNWQKEQNESSQFKISDKDMTRIKASLAQEFRRIFTEQLTAKGETVATTEGTGVLLLRPSIINLDVSAPDRTNQGARSISSAASAGEATLYLELYDSVTGELLARAVDVETAGARGYISVRNGATNRSDAVALLTKWADLLGTFLQNARASAATPMNP